MSYGTDHPALGGATARVFSIRWIVTLLAAGLTAAAVLSVGTVAERNARRALTVELTSRLALEAKNLALTSAGVLLSDYPELTLHPLIKEKLAKQPELSFAVVVDHAGKIQGDADPHRLGLPYEDPAGLRPVTFELLPSTGEDLKRTADQLIVSVPIKHASGKVLGKVVVGMRMSYLDGMIARARQEQTAMLAVFILTGVVISFIVLSHVLRPVILLRAGIERIASGDFDTPVQVTDRTELGLLADAMNEMAAGLKRAQAEVVERERLAREMELAREIQRTILPSERVTAGAYVIEGSQRPAAEVGGDYYDYFALPDGRIGLAVADVSGKGLAGCMVMAMLSALLRADRAASASPSALLTALDERLSETLRVGSFVTMFYGILDPATGRLSYASAGHNPTLIYRSGRREIETIRTRGIPLGAIRGGAIRETLDDLEIVLAPGDALLQYTDGISEAFEPTGQEQFGFARLEAALHETADRGTQAVIEALYERVSDWSGGGARLDDETILVVRRDSAGSVAKTSGRAPKRAPLSKRNGTAGAEDREPLQRYEEARRRGSRLLLTAGSDALEQIRAWLSATEPLGALPVDEADLLTTTLYEVCANVAEHGYGHDPEREYELWWVPPGPGARAGAPGPKARPRKSVPPAGEASRRLRQGCFLIRDDGKPFAANNWQGQDFDDPRVRRRGRGFGLEIIHRAMRRIVYYPSTSVGNVTWMCFGNSNAKNEEVVGHVG